MSSIELKYRINVTFGITVTLLVFNIVFFVLFVFLFIRFRRLRKAIDHLLRDDCQMISLQNPPDSGEQRINLYVENQLTTSPPRLIRQESIVIVPSPCPKRRSGENSDQSADHKIILLTEPLQTFNNSDVDNATSESPPVSPIPRNQSSESRGSGLGFTERRQNSFGSNLVTESSNESQASMIRKPRGDVHEARGEGNRASRLFTMPIEMHCKDDSPELPRNKFIRLSKNLMEERGVGHNNTAYQDEDCRDTATANSDRKLGSWKRTSQAHSMSAGERTSGAWNRSSVAENGSADGSISRACTQIAREDEPQCDETDNIYDVPPLDDDEESNGSQEEYYMNRDAIEGSQRNSAGSREDFIINEPVYVNYGDLTDYHNPDIEN